MVSTARLIRERWSQADALGNRERVATYDLQEFKYPRLRVVERWSGKDRRMTSRLVMVGDHLLVAPRVGVSPEDLTKRLSAQGFRVDHAVDQACLLVSVSGDTDDPDELSRAMDQLAAIQDGVEYAEPDYIVWPCLEPNDPAYIGRKLWGLHNRGGVSGYTADADIDAPEAWGYRTDASSVVVAVTDTGIRYDHQDLATNMWHNPGETPGDGVDNDGNGKIDDIYGYDAYGNDGDPMDDQGHGTHCAGTIGARGNNGIGSTGVAWQVQLMAGRFLGTYGGTTSDAIKVIDYCRVKGADVISASWGGGGPSIALKNAITACANADIPFVAAAGNSGTNNDAYPHYPSSYKVPNIVAVAATDATDTLTGFSCYGRSSVDIAAPGWQIWSSYMGSTSDYRYLQGTSMATPHVSGAMALARAEYPDADYIQLIKALYHSVDKKASLSGKIYTGGRLNVHKLLSDSLFAPDNDSFDKPEVLAGAYGAWSGSNRNASRESAEWTYSPAPETRTLWYAWQAPYDGFATVTTHSLGAGQHVVVFSGTTRLNLKVVWDSGPAKVGVSETVVHFDAKAGVEYRVVAASSSVSGEVFNLELEHIAAHDLLSRAVVLEGESFEVTGSNRGATAQPFEIEAPHAGVGGGYSVWYQWTAPATADFSINTESSDTDTVLAVYTGDPSNPAAFTAIAANDDVDGMHRWSRADFNATQGVTYYIALDTVVGGTPGEFTLRGASPAPPSIVSEPSDLKVLPGGRAVFSVGTSGTPPLRYQWYRNGEAVPGAWFNSLVIDPVQAEAFASYHVVISNSFGSTTSRTATLTEALIPPTIDWNTGHQSLAVGLNLTLRVQARGSEPMTYEWRRDGIIIPSATSVSYAVTSVTSADAGNYECTVSNAAGSAKASMRVMVAASPFDAWQWRLKEIPGPSINEMKVVDTKAYAVCQGRIQVTADGQNWSDWMLPSGFEGFSLAKLGTKWLCSGADASGNARSAISTDGVNWSLSAQTGIAAGGFARNVQVFNGRFIGQRASRSAVYGDVYTSTDGVAWTAATLNGTATAVTANGPFAIANGVMIAGYGPTSIPYEAARVYHTTTGTDWTYYSLPLTGAVYTNSRGACRWNNQFVLFSDASTKGWTSDDGINWTLQNGNAWPGGVDYNGQFVSLGGSAVSVAWGADPWTATQTIIKPTTGDIISAYCVFNNRVLYGTQRGFLGGLTEATGLMPFGGSVSVPTQIGFMDNRFIIIKNSFSGDRNGMPLVSGDGSTWRRMRPWTWGSENRVEAYPLAGFGGGFFWGAHDVTTGPGKGRLPHVMSEFPVANGLPYSVTSVQEGGTTLMAIANNMLYRSNDSGNAWASVATAPVINSSIIRPAASIIRSGSRWLLTNGAPNFSYEYGFVHYSDDGVTWNKTTAKAGYIVPFNGTLYGFENLSNLPGDIRAWKSTNNGTSWTEVVLNSTNKPTNVEIIKLGVFNNSLVALARATGNIYTIWFSNDGISWFPANTPNGVVDFATGVGQFVAYTSTGAILQTGSPPSGGNAPIIRTSYPIHQSTVVSGSWVEVIGEAMDPEGGAITLECRVDGQLIGSSGAGAFRFRFRAMSGVDHTVMLRATDAAGLVGSDELRIKTTPSESNGLAQSAEGRDYLPKVALTEFSGAFYAVGERGLMRSTDGISWQSVRIPSLSAKLYGLAAGNGRLVLQTETGDIFITRDGNNWIQVGLEHNVAGHWIMQPVVFQSGRFLIIEQVAGQSAMECLTSVDGLVWTLAGYGSTSRQAVIGDNGVIVTVIEGIQDKAAWSADGGSNWVYIPDIVRAMGQTTSFAMGYQDGIFLIAANDGRIWRSADGKSWTAGTLPGAPGTTVTVRQAAGRFFVGSSSQLLYSAPATIGGTWQALSLAVMPDAVIHAAGRYIARGASGMVWSHDGVTWSNAQGGPLTSIAGRLSANGDRIIAIDTIGAAWTSTNGVAWDQIYNGLSIVTDTSRQTGQQMAALGSSILLAGTNGMLLHSETDAASWASCVVDGSSVTTTWNFNRVQSSSGVAMACAAVGVTSERIVLRSTDGASWQSIAALAAYRIVDLVGDEAGSWVAVGMNGAVFHSSDDGISWQQRTVTGMVASRAVARFNNQWLIFGSLTANGAVRCWTSSDGASWTDGGLTGLNNINYYFNRVLAHGRLVVWNQSQSPIATSNGTTWQAFSKYVGSANYWLVPRATDFLMATPYISYQTPALMYSGSTDGQTWADIARLQNDTTWATTYNGRLFLFAPGRVVEWAERDLELELLPAAAATLGVGDNVNASAVIRNLGSMPASGVMDVDAWLSNDGFFGDGNDVYVGRIQIDVPEITQGSEWSTSLGFELPGRIRPGDSRLVVVLDPDAKALERNRVNNVSISTSTVVSTPQRRLTVRSFGNGSVSSDQNAEFHPQGARIGFIANPGKGARFAGWGGDAVGSLSEALVIMDTDKTVEANFVSTSVLTLFTRGGGSVEQSSDDGVYTAGATANLTAIPQPGWVFAGWSGSLSGSTPAETLLMNTNKVVTARFSLSLDAWRGQKFSVGELGDVSISGADQDPDGDGVANWREWLRGSDPKDRSSKGQGEMRREGNWMILTYTRMENMPAGHAVSAGVSTDLSNWSAPINERVIGSALGVETIEARFDSTAMPRAFIRIADARPSP